MKYKYTLLDKIYDFNDNDNHYALTRKQSIFHTINHSLELFLGKIWILESIFLLIKLKLWNTQDTRLTIAYRQLATILNMEDGFS